MGWMKTSCKKQMIVKSLESYSKKKIIKRWASDFESLETYNTYDQSQSKVKKRACVFPDIPTFLRFLMGYEFRSYTNT